MERDSSSDEKLLKEIETYNGWLKTTPNSYYTLYCRGMAKAKLGDLESAMADYDQALAMALALDRYTDKILIQRGLLKREMGDLTGALADLDRAVDLHPNPYDALAARAALKKQMGDEPGAAEDDDRAFYILWP